MVADSEFVVRDAEPSDAAAIARVHVDAWREAYSGIFAEHHFGPEAFDRRRSFWTMYLELAPRPGRLVVAERGGAVVGFANSGESDNPDAEHGFVPVRPLHLFAIYLLESAHGTGVGQRMLDAVLGAEPAQLWVLRGNQRATRFYARNGFVADGTEFSDPADSAVVSMRLVR